MEGYVTNIQRFSMHDGPGVRTTVFFKGCPLRCLWCHNPETYRFGWELRYDRASCMFCTSCVNACPSGALRIHEEAIGYDKTLCRSCGSCVNACPTGAIAETAACMSTEDILTEVLRDREMYRRSGGGVTLSGGEATAQPELAAALLEELKKEGIHTALDTCGFCEKGTFRSLSERADLILFDIKHSDPLRHKELTGQDNALILENFEQLEELGAAVEIRVPVVPTMNSDDGVIRGIGNLIRGHRCVRRVVLLGYHPLGQTKIYDFDEHGRDLQLERPQSAELQRLAALLEETSGKPAVFR